MSFPPARTFTPETVTAQKTSSFWLKSPEGAPFSSIPICCDRHMAVKEPHASQSERLCRNPRAILGLSAGGGGERRHCHRSPRVSVTLGNPHSRKQHAFHPDYSKPANGSHQGTGAGTVFQKEVSQPCYRSHGRLPHIRPHPLTQSGPNFLLASSHTLPKQNIKGKTGGAVLTCKITTVLTCGSHRVT